MRSYLRTLQIGCLTLFCVASVNAQDVQNSRRMSQKVSLTGVIGTTEVKIEYHSPTAKGRKIFGRIVPYDFVVDGKEYAWRAGSNQRTTIEFGNDVQINGNAMKAGKYGLVVLVSEKEWTFVFTSDMSWGAFQYEPSQDVLRVTVAVEEEPFQEWLSYSFVNPQAESIGIKLYWTDVSATLEVGTDVSANIMTDLQAKEEKTASDYLELATEWQRTHPNDYDKMLAYVDSAITKLPQIEEKYMKQHEEFSCNIMKADLLIAGGDKKTGKALREETLASSIGFNLYYYGLNMYMVKGNKKEAYRLLSENIKNNPKQWQGHLALGEYYLKENDQNKAVEAFKMSYEYAPDNWKNYARYLYLQNKVILERE